jgi:hypothetical protein
MSEAAGAEDKLGRVSLEARNDFVDGAVAELLLERWGPPAAVARDRGARRLSPPSRSLAQRPFDAAAFVADPHVNQIWMYEHTHRGRLRLKAPQRSFLTFRDGLMVGGWSEQQTGQGEWVRTDD